MLCRFPLTVSALLVGLVFAPVPAVAQSPSSSNYRILAREEGGFNVSAVKSLLDRGDRAVSNGKLVQARKHYDEARKVAKQLLSFYRDIGGSFRGLDARIPREMDNKGRKAAALLAKVNLRLAALFRRQDQPEVAVPVLVEVIKLMTPAKPEGQKAYQSLVELGFVETPYAAARSRS